MKIENSEIIASSKTVSWKSGMGIDADGAPNAYGPKDKPGLDYLANAGHEGSWYGLACDANECPYVQGDSDPYPGMFVSTTALQDKTKAASDPARYVDSGTIPYIAVPPELIKQCGVAKGDLGTAYYPKTGKTCGFIVADVGPHNKIGEGSIALAEALGIPSSPKHGGASGGVYFVVYLKTSAGWPRSLEDIQARADAGFQNFGGIQRFGA